MKSSILLAALGLSLAAAAQAQTPTPTPTPAPAAPASTPARPDFASKKAEMLGRLDQRLAEVTAMRDCVSAANSRADLKSCHKQGHMHHPRNPA